MQHGPQVRERHVHLRVEPFDELAGLGINPQLPGGEDEVADTDRLVIRADRGHGLGRIDERMHFLFPHFFRPIVLGRCFKTRCTSLEVSFLVKMIVT